MTVLERGWLSANGILFDAPGHPTALVDSGYCTHADQTVALVGNALGERPLDLLLNTHLHSDHCGGNAALQARYPAMQTAIPPGEADAVARWDETALSYLATGQECPQFAFQRLLEPGQEITLGGLSWQVLAAPGHDAHAVVLFEPGSRTLLSGDALWAEGFGVVFPELEGDDAFGAVAGTLDLIEALDPAVIVPGHGPVFHDVQAALATARRRLAGFLLDPARHAGHAARVLLKFRLLDWQRRPLGALLAWAGDTAYLRTVHRRYFPGLPFDAWAGALVADLERAGAARREGAWVLNT
ncbi:MBL fold metallo-hydrolase [Xylophilus sp. GOD-11R]|uniref:MBL fold metallo-hydrolase n=1 Tax=Xylophilus sp. GOD-11R TaxID=3089814 RepID=UPI00298C23C5|nr:MBL fold metallo-hydrolase [Xylophilus sp. GOD-11R]WPB56364.1 MBL fold metallo-hydrolase [Xylophilus sp. GOD-11R]